MTNTQISFGIALIVLLLFLIYVSVSSKNEKKRR